MALKKQKFLVITYSIIWRNIEEKLSHIILFELNDSSTPAV